MCDQHRLRPACAYAQSDQSHCWSLAYFTSVKLLAKQHLDFLSLKEAAEAVQSLHLSNDHIVGNHMSWLSSSCTGNMPFTLLVLKCFFAFFLIAFIFTTAGDWDCVAAVELHARIQNVLSEGMQL